jgi:ABC-type microcin C transport system permease subunit YejE
MFSPLTKKRFRAFKRIKRAWYSLIALAVVYVFCQIVNLFVGVDDIKPVDPSSLEAFVKPTFKNVYDVRTARFNVGNDGEVYGFEGPESVFEAIKGGEGLNSALEGFAGEYNVIKKEREDYTRYYLDPKAEPSVEVVKCPATCVSFPFAPCSKHPFGLDNSGRDVLLLVIHGMRIALNFGLVLAFSGMLIGLVIGSVEGYFGGWIDVVCQRFTEVWSAMPFLYVMIFIGDTLGRSFGILLFCYAIFNWIAVSYYMRAEFFRLRSRTFVEAAKCQGFSAWRIIFGHILPNALTPLITLFPFLLMGAIGSLAALDFLGFGLPPMTPSCGELLKQAQADPSSWWLIFFPAAALFIVMLLTVLVGEGLRDAFDPRQKSKLE